MNLPLPRAEWIGRFVLRLTKAMPGLSRKQINAAARAAFEFDGGKRAPEMVADLHALSPLPDSSWLARFAAELLRLIPGLTGLDAVRAAKREFERQQSLDPEEAARAYTREIATKSGGE